MNFEHSEERVMLSDTITRFIHNEYPMRARVEAAFSGDGFDTGKWSQFADLGVISALFTEDQGGFGGKGFDITVVFEALGRGLVVEPILDNALLPGIIFAAAGDAGRIENIIDGSKRYAIAADEVAAQYERAWVETTARKEGDGYVLSGHKTGVKFADAVDGFIVSARTDGDADDESGVSLFLVSPGANGVIKRGYYAADGGRTAEIALDNVQVPAGTLIGAEGAGLKLLNTALDRGLVALSAEGLGIMERIKEMTLDYLRTRTQFGVPIGRFQALQHRMAQVLIDIEQARSAVINAASALDSEEPDREKILSATKYTIGDVGARVAEESIQLHGGIGMTWEFDLSHFAKRLIMIDHELGDSDYHLGRYIRLSRQAYREPAATAG